jgi:hypothetical protein
MILAEFFAPAQNAPTHSAPLSKYTQSPRIALFSHKCSKIRLSLGPHPALGAGAYIFNQGFRRDPFKILGLTHFSHQRVRFY